MLSCYERAGEFDVDQRPHGPARRRARRRSSTTPVVHTVHGPLDGEPGELYEQIGAVAPEVGLISLSLNQRRPKPDLNWVANMPERARPRALPVPAAPGRLPALPRPHEPREGRAPRGRGRDGARAAAQARRARCASRRSSEYFAEFVEPHLGDRIEYLGEVNHGDEGRAAAGRARDALPDRVGGAVRTRHDRVDGLRDAGDRDAARRGARGDREDGRGGIIVDD